MKTEWNYTSLADAYLNRYFAILLFVLLETLADNDFIVLPFVFITFVEVKVFPVNSEKRNTFVCFLDVEETFLADTGSNALLSMFLDNELLKFNDFTIFLVFSSLPSL